MSEPKISDPLDPQAYADNYADVASRQGHDYALRWIVELAYRAGRHAMLSEQLERKAEKMFRRDADELDRTLPTGYCGSQ